MRVWDFNILLTSMDVSSRKKNQYENTDVKRHIRQSGLNRYV